MAYKPLGKFHVPIPPGNRFGKLVVIRRAHDVGERPGYLCICDCGKKVVVQGKKLRSDHSTSCGCKHRKRNGTTISQFLTYQSWQGMMARCYKPGCKAFKKYGEKGIFVFGPWHDFETFLRDVGPRPTADHSIDRHPNNKSGSYEPGNVRWATRVEQMNNVSSNLLITKDGQTKTLAEWCRALTLSYPRIAARIRYGWTPEEALVPGLLWCGSISQRKRIPTKRKMRDLTKQDKVLTPTLK